ncbi:MAG: hypothetical protein IGR76_15740 [Synechococcales cyanobacterium T60_A2020_003]|nr:hypothetical protein [Synechococcales cyanobacterium T60_A2020_003]
MMGGQAGVHSALYMATLVTVPYPLLMVFYPRLLAAGKAKKVAPIACIHRLLTMPKAMVIRNPIRKVALFQSLLSPPLALDVKRLPAG